MSKKILNKHGVEIGKFQRKAGKEYCDVIDNLSLANKLENLKGNFVRIVCQGINRSYRICRVTDFSEKDFAKPVKFIINCCGFEDLHSSSELILSLIINNIWTNASKQV
jgi:uncharacterized NAD(P)/FAD-binding protein YdhS